MAAASARQYSRLSWRQLGFL